MSDKRSGVLLLAAGLLSFLTAPRVALAQQAGAAALEEIVVTARKREENLQDVPVSISVISADLISKAGILEVKDLYDLTPGLVYDTNFGDRNSSTPGIRGVQSLEIAPTRQKASTFIDGIPLVGQQGNLGLGGLAGVEVYRGPQSAAFGRATFAGAINYVTADPTPNFTGSVLFGSSDLGRNRLSAALSGPINDKIGYRIDLDSDDFAGPSEWVSSDGYDLGGTSAKELAFKMKFAPTDHFDAEFRYQHRETDDDPSNRYMLQDSAGCSNYTAPNGRAYYRGAFDCNIAIPPGGIPLNHDLTKDYIAVGTVGFTQAQLDQFALSYSVAKPLVQSNRNRLQTELNWDVGDSRLQVLGFRSKESYMRWWDSDTSDTPLTITAMGGALGASMNVNTMADPSNISENYAEVRWISPEDKHVRYVFGASYYDYDFLTNIFAQYGAVYGGFADQLGVGPVQIFSEQAKNTGVFFNLMYDITPKTTFSVEGRRQIDDISNLNNVTGQSFHNETKSFQPRVAINHTISSNVSVYAQYAKGNNPAGVNVSFTDPSAILALEDARTAGQITYDENTFLDFKEEKLTNVEVGVKGSFADRRVRLAAALYTMDWEDMVQPYNLDWNGAWNDGTSPNAITYNMGMAWIPPYTMSRTFLNQGTAKTTGVETEVSYEINRHFDLRGTAAYMKSEYTDFCSLYAVDTLGFTPDLTTQSGSPYNCVIVNGNETVRTPKVSFSAGLTYRADIANSNWRWSVYGDVRHSGSNYLDDVNLLQLPAVDIFNVALNFGNETWDIRAFVNNLADENTPTIIEFAPDFGADITGATDGFRVTPRAPREFGVTATYRF
jgi:iron complex outermembrane recepter protein